MTTATREVLLRAANLIRPALANKEYIPALTHIQFNQNRATAFNDVSAISVACDSPVACCVPGELFIRALSGFGGAEVSMQIGKQAELALKSGRSAVKLPTLPAGDFPFEVPNPNEGEVMAFSRSIIAAIEKCLLSVGTDAAHPAQMGVTLDTDNQKAVLYSTDNYSVSRCATDAKLKLPGDAPVILPRFFCEQLIGLAKAFPKSSIDFVLYAGALVVEFGHEGADAMLFTKTPVDLEPMDFPRIMAKHAKLDALKGLLAPIPDAFDGALGRALLVLGGELKKRTKVVPGDGVIGLLSTSAMGEAEDSMPFEMDEHEFEIDPALVSRGAKACALMAFTRQVTIMADGDIRFVHLIAHRAD